MYPYCHPTGQILSLLAMCHFVSLFIIVEDQIWSKRNVTRLLSAAPPPPCPLSCRDTVQCVAVSGPWVVCGLQNGEAQLWSLLTRSLAGPGVVARHGAPVTAVGVAAVEAGGAGGVSHVVLTGSWKGEVRLWSVRTMSSLGSVRVDRHGRLKVLIRYGLFLTRCRCLGPG